MTGLRGRVIDPDADDRAKFGSKVDTILQLAKNFSEKLHKPTVK